MFSKKQTGGSPGADGKDGVDGKSAYQIAVDEGFNGTVSEWLNSLKGEKGDTGAQGIQGVQGVPGVKGDPGADGFGTQEQYNEIIARLEALETPTSED